MAVMPPMFEKVFCINLARRSERWEQFALGLPKPFPFGFPERIRAVDGQLCKPPTWWEAGLGAWGCYRTHLNILEDCINRGVQSVLILEDDSVFPERFNEYLEDFLEELPTDWAMVYLGGQHLKKPKEISHNVWEAKNVNRTHAYGLRGDMLQTIYNHLCGQDWKPKDHIDHHLGKLQEEQGQRIYCPRNWLVGQRKGPSDVWKDGKFPTRFFPSANDVK